MIKYHNINGQIVPAEEASIFVSDVGLLRGYGIFDFFPIREGQPLFARDYFDRFYRSAALMLLKVPIDRKQLYNRIVELCEANGLKRAHIKLVLTGGYSKDGYTPGDNNLLILQHPDFELIQDHYEFGITLVLQKYLKDEPEIKTLHYANAIKQRETLSKFGAMDVLYHDGRHIRETSRANFFIIDKSGTLYTSASDVLSGITRKHVLKVASAQGLTIEEGPLPLHMIPDASECFITSTTKGVLPVTKIGDYDVGDGQVGPVCRNLQLHYLAYCEQYREVGYE